MESGAPRSSTSESSPSATSTWNVTTLRLLSSPRWCCCSLAILGACSFDTTNKEDNSGHFHIFVGDLSNEVSDEVLLQAFAAFADYWLSGTAPTLKRLFAKGRGARVYKRKMVKIKHQTQPPEGFFQREESSSTKLAIPPVDRYEAEVRLLEKFCADAHHQNNRGAAFAFEAAGMPDLVCPEDGQNKIRKVKGKGEVMIMGIALCHIAPAML
ncbi:Uu.00g094530.m01.CDS01 [Anthostomella pinea]|uniref:Uu.00g094530.m01.CDS01 n=1 Tax=Anthostomella pinea TaxID=933095 RepID=A0AAI8YKP5_9PEZI|nr:Uu.00g094530.m01.CDS01 [Anthostomella pinea]